MNTYIGKKSLVLDGLWTEIDQQFVLIIRAEGWKEASYGQLRNLIFSWHERSWYGTEIDETKLNNRTIIKLTPLQAYEFLMSPAPTSYISLEFSQRLSSIAQAAKRMTEILIKGWFEPDTANWSMERTAWRVILPDDQVDCWRELESQIGQKQLQQWFTLVVERIIEQEQEVAQAWKNLVKKNGESQFYTKITDADEWLSTIGYQKDTSPFKLALSLHEPIAHSKRWMLQSSIYDQADEIWYQLHYDEYLNRFTMSNKQESQRLVPFHWVENLKQKLKNEYSRYVQLLEANLQTDEHYIIKHSLTEHEAWSFLEVESEQLLQAGCKVLLPPWWEQIRNRKLKIKGKVKSALGSAAEPMFGLQQIVQFDWKFAIGDKEISEQDFLKIAESNRKLIQLGDEWVYLSPEDIAQVKKWLKNVHKKKGLTFSDVLQMHLRGEHADFLEEENEYSLSSEIELNEHLYNWLDTLRNIQNIPLIDKPEMFHGELRPYQLQGASWLVFLRRFGLGAVLADDMGLGKTIQFIAYLTYLKAHEPDNRHPSLLICPTSVIGNWERELSKFAPDLKVRLHYGTKRARGEQLDEFVQDVDLVITSYALAHIDSEDLLKYQWNALCLDEAQNIKNAYTKQAIAIRKLPAQHRIALTGTPMENRLTELWSIYDFINPGYLGSLYQFKKSMIGPIERDKDEQKIAGLQRWVKPFMLRRVKKDPAISLSLPDKIETKSYIPLTTEQVSLYEGIVKDLMHQLDRGDIKQRRGLILGSLTKLKQLCDHPALLLNQEAKKHWDISRSSKLERLLEIVDQIAEQKERCLIFTQYIDMGQQIQRILQQRYNVDIPYLHGGVMKQKRDEMIDSFQNEAHKHIAFVLSLKAGGIGLNLTAANHVIHFDRWWNPAVENQATDRAFRIGQKRQVEVHKFITIGTLEEKIDEMIDSKMTLNEQIVQQSDQWITELSSSELRELFTLRNTWLRE